MMFFNSEIGLNINIDEALIKELNNLSLKYYPNEFGGILIGKYSEDRKTVFVLGTVLPKEFKSSRFGYYRGARGLKKVLQNLFNINPSKYYVGEWHSHPDNPAIPSGIDLQAFRKIALHDKVYIENPLLLILSVNKTFFDFCFYVFFDNEFYRYEKEK